MVTVSPRFAAASTATPSVRLTASEGIFGRRFMSSTPGVPQMVEAVDQWMRSPGLVATMPSAPISSISEVSIGRLMPSVTTILPRKRFGSSFWWRAYSRLVGAKYSIGAVTPCGTLALNAGGFAR